MTRRRAQSGFTLMEILIAVTFGAVIVTALSTVVTRLTDSRMTLESHGERAQEARFAMDRMLRAVRESRDLLLPLADVPDTDWREDSRDETVPPSNPEGSSTRASAVLAVSLGARVDLDVDGIPDADNDRDGRIDEDLPADMTFDDAPGNYLVDDDGDGVIDSGGQPQNDDEQPSDRDEDPLNGLDDDGDGLIDEDVAADMNGDGEPGIRGVDDDGDGQVDEGNDADDDEDGSSDEDWLDPVVFYLKGGELIERHPLAWDESNSDGITGRDFVESTIAANVSRFSVRRIAGTPQLVDITLELADAASGESIMLRSWARIGSAP
jgi:Tfp pilus assembly protein PilV